MVKRSRILTWMFPSIIALKFYGSGGNAWKSSRGINLRLSLQTNKSMRIDVASWLPIAILHYSFCDIALTEPLFWTIKVVLAAILQKPLCQNRIKMTQHLATLIWTAPPKDFWWCARTTRVTYVVATAEEPQNASPISGNRRLVEQTRHQKWPQQ